MTINAQKKYLRLGLGLLFVMSAILSFFVMFKSGCAGDIKGGALGNLVRAQELEGLGNIISVLSAAFGGAAYGLVSRSRNRIAHSVAFALFSLVCFWLAGMQFNTWGVQSCFQP